MSEVVGYRWKSPRHLVEFESHPNLSKIRMEDGVAHYDWEWEGKTSINLRQVYAARPYVQGTTTVLLSEWVAINISYDKFIGLWKTALDG